MCLLELHINIAIELPNIDAVEFSYSDDLLVVSWVKEDIIHLVRVTNETLEEVRMRLLGIVVPDLYHVVLATS